MRARASGFTLIELMVTLAVLSVLMVLAVPTFNDFRQRAALRGAADQIVSFWGDARFEAVRRNTRVKVGVVRDAGGQFCIGAATTTDPADDTACTCLEPDPALTTCNIAQYPTAQTEWRRVRILGNPAWGDADGDLQGVVVIDPKRGNITQAADAGIITLQSPAGGSLDFRLNAIVDRNGRALLCEPAAAPSKLPQYSNRTC